MVSGLFQAADFISGMALLLQPRGPMQYIRSHLLDRTFLGLYHANAFDLALLIPYFIVLVWLASYGIHRYTLVYLYYKNKKNRANGPLLNRSRNWHGAGGLGAHQPQ